MLTPTYFFKISPYLKIIGQRGIRTRTYTIEDGSLQPLHGVETSPLFYFRKIYFLKNLTQY